MEGVPAIVGTVLGHEVQGRLQRGMPLVNPSLKHPPNPVIDGGESALDWKLSSLAFTGLEIIAPEERSYGI